MKDGAIFTELARFFCNCGSRDQLGCMYRVRPHLPLCIVLLAFIVAGMTMTAQAQKSISNPLEYNAYVSAISEQQPQVRIGKLEAFLQSYPNSAVSEDTLEVLMATYEKVGDVPQAISTAERLLQINPSNRAALALMAQKTQQRAVDDKTPLLGSTALSVPPPRIYVEPSTRLLRNTFEVPAGRGLTHNFTLTRGTRLVAHFQVTGGFDQSIDVLLLDVANYQRYMAGQQFSAFQGTSGMVKEIAQYTFQVPQTNIYYLVLDNRRGWLLPRQVTLHAHAILPEPTAEHVHAQRALAEVYQNLKGLFVFPDFQISLRYCGAENAFSDPNITLCKELIEAMGEQRLETGTATTFVFLHELGHSLLRLWEQPGWDNEDFADEFATVLMMMGKQQSGALQIAQWWTSRTSEQEALAKLWQDDRHSLSPQRARNIIRWLNQEDDLFRRWDRVFVPHMQTEVLSSMLEESDRRIDKQYVLTELQRRRLAK